MSDNHDLQAFSARLEEEILNLGTRYNDANLSWTEPVFNQLALDLFGLQFSSNPAYHRFCKPRAAQPGEVVDWKSIPAIPTEAFKELTLTSIPEKERTKVFHSSGTTGQKPSRHFHSPASLTLYGASLWAWFVRHLCGPGNVRPGWLLVLSPRREEAPRSSLVHMFEYIASRLNPTKTLFACRAAMDGGWEIEGRKTLGFLESAATSSQPGLVLTTAFGLVQLSDLLSAETRRFQLPKGSGVMETGGYKGRSRALAKAELHQIIIHSLGIPITNVVSEYGMSELSSQAYDHRAGNPLRGGVRVFHFPPWARARVVSPETGAEVADGETGLIQVFDLANVFSVLAVQTGDLGVRRGNGFELIGRAEHLEPRGCSLMAIT